jgi:hyperosmotically inducible periplasmic protein
MDYTRAFGALVSGALLTLAPVAAASAGGPAAEAPRPQAAARPAADAKASVADSLLTARTKIALFGDERVKSGQVSVETSRGTVTLRGKVDSADARAAAIAVAREIAGVKNVRSDLQVVPPHERKQVDAVDRDITRKVEETLKRDPRLKRVDARTDRGVVLLQGEVQNLDASARASEVSRRVPGVRAVKNEIALDGDGTRERSLAALLLLAVGGRSGR